MAKAMSFFGMAVAGLMALVFGLDLVIGVPFEGANMVIDIGFLVGGLILGYMSWDALRASG